uniref:LisH domain-containing protein n=1 Tax=Globodera rostochiensis TaxID=31243 RepID=A0A914HLW6_GLORO
MFQQQPPPHAQMQQQRKENYLSSDVQAREKLSQFVYEYLYQLGATKTAETFKNEFLAHNMPNLQIDLSSSSGPGFLYNWWSVFWDLYSAHPDKKDKMFPNYNNVPPDAAAAMVNGGMYGPGGGAVFPNPAMGPGAPPQNLPDGMFPNAAYYGPRGGPQPGPSSNQASPIPGGGGPPRYGQQGTRSGAPTPSSVVGVGGPNFPMGIGPPQMMTLNEQQQMRLMMAARQQHQQQQQANQAVRMQMNNGGRAVRAQFNNAQYMDSPSGTPPFHNPLVHNGVGGGGAVMCPTTASLMSPAGAPGGAPQQQDVSQQQHQQHFMMANQVPVSMQSQFANHHDSSGGGGGGAVGTPGGGGGGGTGPASVSAQNTMNNGNGGLGEQSGDGGGRALPNGGGANGPLHSLLNGTASDGGGGGTEMKQSPPFSGGGGGGVNGGTPGSNVGGGGGGGSQTAGPSSVHSQSGGGGGGGQQQSQQQQSSSMGDGAMEFHQSSEEISKIKASLMDDFQQHQFQQQ